MYLLVMIDLPLIHKDAALLGNVEAIQCCVSCRAAEGRGLCQTRAGKPGHVSGSFLLLHLPHPNSLPTTVSISSTGRKCQEEGRGKMILPLPWLLFFNLNKCLRHFSLCPAVYLAILRSLGNAQHGRGVRPLTLGITRPTHGQRKCAPNSPDIVKTQDIIRDK